MLVMAALGCTRATAAQNTTAQRPAPVRAAHKSGETDQVRAECSLFYLRNRIIACVLTKENKDMRYVVDAEAHLTIARMGEAIVNAWGRIPKT